VSVGTLVGEGGMMWVGGVGVGGKGGGGVVRLEKRVGYRMSYLFV
jgi:hypothetical protein